jgi:hypothetical protein
VSHLINRIAMGLALLFLTVQVGVATVLLSQPRPARFGWQMYSGIREALAYGVVRSDGSVEWVQRADYFGNFRIDLDDIVEPAAAMICARRPDATAVRANYLGGAQKDVPCRR